MADPVLKTVAYNTLVRPTLEYACTVWDPYTQKNVNKIEMVQRRAARYALNRYHNTSSVTEMLEQLDWAPLEERRKFIRLCMFYKIRTGLVDLGKPITMATIPRTSRHFNTKSVKVPLSRTQYHQMSFFPRTIRDWNSLPNSVVEAPSLASYKGQLKAHLEENR